MSETPNPSQEAPMSATPANIPHAVEDRESNYLHHARSELARLAKVEGLIITVPQMRAIEGLIEAFDDEGHSGGSAPFGIGAIVHVMEKILSFEPLTPLTGEADEWMEVGSAVWQNKRCSHVFKQPDRYDGQPYDITALVFREPSGCCFTSVNSHRVITFPYTPSITYVDVDEDHDTIQPTAMPGDGNAVPVQAAMRGCVLFDDFQRATAKWGVECFGADAVDVKMRGYRFIEEAFELVQATGVSADECRQVCNYVYERPVGEIAQEVGGVLITLSLLASATGRWLEDAADTELGRCQRNIEQIRTKHQNKPRFGPLPS